MVAIFPTFPGVTFPVKRRAVVSTARHESIGGKRTLLPLRSVPRWEWELPFDVLRSSAYSSGSYSELETLLAFYNNQSTSGMCFNYLDSEDNSATAQQFATGDGSTTAFQLLRARGGFSEPVYSPIAGYTVYVNGVAKTLGTDYTQAKGAITFAAAPASGAVLTWTGQFYWLCRFTEDMFEESRFSLGLHEAKSLKFASEILP